MTTGDGSSTGQPGGGAADATGGNPARDADAVRNIGRPASNFAFLQGEWPALYDEALHAERLAHADPRAACFYARRTLELAVHWMYQADAATLHRPYKSDLNAMLHEPSMRNLVGPAVHAKMNLIRVQGNNAVHKAASVVPKDAVRTTAELFHVMYWLARTYAQQPADLPAAGTQFDTQRVPRPVPAEIRIRKQEELRKQAEEDKARYEAQAKELAEARAKGQALEAELVALRARVASAKAANQARVDDHDYDEAATRDLFIDLLLKEAGWALDQDRDREFEVTGMPTSSGKGYVDYVLWGDDDRPLGIVEAKRTRRDAREGQQQAKLYADALEAKYKQRPVIFYTNGYETFIWDDGNGYPARPVQGFRTKDELHWLLRQRAGRRTLTSKHVNPAIAGRPYQLQAIQRVGEAFERDRQRQALLVMATGTGKTRTTVALADVLQKAGWARRILFLADRQALVTQAVKAFKQHLEHTPTVNLLTEKNLDARVFVSTYPTMMNLIDETSEDGRRRFGPGFFDLIVIDEAHRSVYDKYGQIFDYFDSLLLGLTATPKDEIDRNTYRLFHLEDGVPTDSYGLHEAAGDGFLVLPKTVDVPLKIMERGIRYADLTEEQREAWDNLEWTEDGQVPDEVTADEINRYLFNAPTVDILQRRGDRRTGRGVHHAPFPGGADGSGGLRMRIRAVLWDIDDTIFDYSGAEREGALQHFEADGLLAAYGGPSGPSACGAR